MGLFQIKKAVLRTAFSDFSKMILTVFYDDITSPDTLHRKEKSLSSRRSIPDDEAPDIPSEPVMPVREKRGIGQKMYLQK